MGCQQGKNEFSEARDRFRRSFDCFRRQSVVNHSRSASLGGGTSHRGKLLVVVHAERGENIRIISARPASRREQESYEETTSEIQRDAAGIRFFARRPREVRAALAAG